MIVPDELSDRLDNAIELAMAHHESVKDDSECSCGVRNNMDGDVLFSHRVGAVQDAVREALEKTGV